MWLSSGLAPSGPGSYFRGPRAGCNIPGGVSQDWNRGKICSPDLLAMFHVMQPGVQLAFWTLHGARSCLASHLLASQVLLLRAVLNSLSDQPVSVLVVLHLGGFP